MNDRPPVREHQLDVLRSITELMDTLPTPEAKREVLAFLAASQGVTIKDPPAPRTGKAYGYGYKRRG